MYVRKYSLKQKQFSMVCHPTAKPEIEKETKTTRKTDDL